MKSVTQKNMKIFRRNMKFIFEIFGQKNSATIYDREKFCPEGNIFCIRWFFVIDLFSNVLYSCFAFLAKLLCF